MTAFHKNANYNSTTIKVRNDHPLAVVINPLLIFILNFGYTIIHGFFFVF